MALEKNEAPVAIRISGVKKMYRLGQIGGGTLQADLQSWWARKRGKEDPNVKIGQEHRLPGQTFLALDDINLTVRRGEALGIIGANGAGKSTLLKLLSRITAPTEGEIDLYGRVASVLEVGTGFHGEMTGRENIYMNGAILGMTRAEIDAKMEDIIEFSEVREFIDTPVKRYSSGMYVKLAFSVAAHLDSEILIMDEVLAVGDMAFQRKCLEKMCDAADREGRTVLYVSHNMNTIRQLCNRCIVLDHGKIIYDGSVDEAIRIYTSVAKNGDTYTDYTHYQRPGWLREPQIRTLDAQYPDKDNICFDCREPMKLHIRWENLRDIENMGLRLEVRTPDDVAQTAYVLYRFYSGRQGERGEVTLVLDLSLLAPATYKFIFTFFYVDRFGNNQDLDSVPGLYFDVLPSGEDGGKELVWRTQKYGHVKMADSMIRSWSLGVPAE